MTDHLFTFKLVQRKKKMKQITETFKLQMSSDSLKEEVDRIEKATIAKT